jgi:general secretion pathway protein G
MKINNIKATSTRGSSLRQSAFTLVELLLVLTILAILAGIVLPKIAGRGEQARETAAKADMASIKTALSMFEVDNGYFPRGRDGLQALMVKPREAQNWRGPYLEKAPVDPWNNPYVYENPGKKNPTGYDLYSKGQTGQGGNDAIWPQ